MGRYVCYKCGGEQFRRSRPASGRWIETVHFNDDGSSTTEESTTDGVFCGPEPVLMHCEGCGASQPNPEHPDWNPSKERLFNKLATKEALGTLTKHELEVIKILIHQRRQR